MLFGDDLGKIVFLHKMLTVLREWGLLLMHLPVVKEYKGDINATLKRLGHSLLNNVIFSYLNINSIRNKLVISRNDIR